MSQRKNPLSQGRNSTLLPGQKRGKPQPPQLRAAQPKTATTSQAKTRPVAPPVYRPQAALKTVQAKSVDTKQNQKQTVAPPVYRPQLVPKVLQTKISSGQPPPAGQTPRQPVAPPAYRPQPQPRVLQTKASQTKAPVGQRVSATGVLQGKFPEGLQQVTQSCRMKGAIQAKLQGSALQLPANVTRLRTGGGQPLPPDVLQRMEPLFGTSFQDVRLHTSPSVKTMGALALTQGSDIYFAAGLGNINTPQGQMLLAHELTHVVQQRAGRVRNPFGSGLAAIQDRSMEAEAERMEMRAAQTLRLVQPKPQGLIQTQTTRPMLQAHALKPQPRFQPNLRDPLAGKTIQPKIPLNYTQWLAATGAADSAANQTAFWKEFGREDAKRANEYLKDGAERTAMEKAAKDWGKAKTVANLDKVVATVNAGLESLPYGGGRESYIADQPWAGGLEAMNGALAILIPLIQAAPANPAAAPGGAGMPNIPVIYFSVLNASTIPNSLKRLLRDIYYAWLAGTYIDERTQADRDLVRKDDKGKTVGHGKIGVDISGAVRSWHMNQSGSLPALQIPHAGVGAKGQNLHDYLIAKSDVPNNVAGDAPIGYAEYTGAGETHIHNIKVVFDYINGRMYLSVTHYQLWKTTAAAGVYKALGQVAVEGGNSAWFFIDMTQ